MALVGLEYRVGDSGPHITHFQEWANRFAKSYAPKIDGYYGYADRDFTNQLRARLRPPLPANGGVFDEETAACVGYKFPAYLKIKHLAVVYRGTGGVIGQDLVSRVCQGVGDLVEERNPDFPASMGGLPPGAPNTPSAKKACDIGFESGKREITEALRKQPTRGIVLGGYSLGAVVAAMLREWLLENHPDNYVCSFSFGDPTRPFGGSYYLGPVLAGQGISSWRYGDVKDYRHCWLTHPDDMYGNIPLGDTGDIMDNFYDGITSTQLSDPIGTTKALTKMILESLETAGVPLPEILKGLAGGFPALINMGISVLVAMLPGLIASAGGNINKLTGPAAAAQAAIIALRFLASGTAPHINYHTWEVWPGQTYLGLGIQHVRDWCSRRPAVLS